MMREDGAGSDNIDANTLIGVVKRRNLRQTDDSCLSCDVGCQIGDAIKSRERSHIDDCSPARPDHCRDLILHLKKRAPDVCANAAIKVSRIYVGEWGREGTVVCIVECCIKSSERAQRSLDKIRDGCDIAHIRRYCQSPPSA